MSAPRGVFIQPCVRGEIGEQLRSWLARRLVALARCPNSARVVSAHFTLIVTRSHSAMATIAPFPHLHLLSLIGIALLLLTAVHCQQNLICQRKLIDETTAQKTTGSNNFHIEIQPHPINGSTKPLTGYVPGAVYSIIIEGWRTRYTAQTFRGFTLVAVAADSTNDSTPIGSFKIKSNNALRWSSNCWHAVTHTSLFPKTRVLALWQAPLKDAGCVKFKAALLEDRDLWYMDEEGLTKSFCLKPDYVPPEEECKPVECCACDEVRYHLTFDGIWSRQTHPKDFPSLEHLTHFSDLIGASHSHKYVMWAFGGYASDGLKELAEWGNTQKYEEEIRDQGTEVRTIIKARGLWYPNVQGIAKASFRTDRYHHLMSLASMLGPSPDWVVGVSSLDLCLKNCTWVDKMVIDLFPWDAGVDNGVTYMSPNNPSIPQQRIKPITTKDPDDPRSPFYNPASDEMPTFARLTLEAKKIYKSQCKELSEYAKPGKTGDMETSEDLENKDKKECVVGSWTPWSLCSATCGKGIRMRSRVYKNHIKAQIGGCSRQLSEKQFCNAAVSICAGSDAFNSDMCAVTTWALWTDCSANCGKGYRSRVRNYLNPMAIKKCSVDLTVKEECIGPLGEDCDATPDPRCQMTAWSQWSPCSQSCGDGVRVRTRLFYFPENRHECENYDLVQKDSCNVQSCDMFYKQHATEICSEPLESGQCQGVFPRYYYNNKLRSCQRFTYSGCKGNRNNFESQEQCLKACGNEEQRQKELFMDTAELVNAPPEDLEDIGDRPVDCVLDEWSAWSECSRTCNSGQKARTRMIRVQARNGGQPCPPNLVEKMRCRLRPCPNTCRVGPWTEWSPCSATCGTGVQTRHRNSKASGRGRSRYFCPARQVEKRVCIAEACMYDYRRQ